MTEREQEATVFIMMSKYVTNLIDKTFIIIFYHFIIVMDIVGDIEEISKENRCDFLLQ